jgi:pyridoxal phosphate enzyme (YggS family)
MNYISNNLKSVLDSITDSVQLVAVTKNQNIADIRALYEAGHRIFGENRVQELVGKSDIFPDDVQWHLIGHLQTNKVKYIAPFIDLIQSVDNEKLLQEIDRQALKNNRVIKYLLQLHVAQEETKFGFSLNELQGFFANKIYSKYPNTQLIGIMGMASNTENIEKIKSEFQILKSNFDKYQNTPLQILSMGMSGDYKLAIECGSNMVRVGSALFAK